jgi:ADP-ribose pyrophosphatase YjhB (NUDIX family)
MSKPKRPTTRAGKRKNSRKWSRGPNASGTKVSPRAGGGGRLRHFYDVRQYALLTDTVGHILILQLPKEYDESAANTWTLPGGKLEPMDEPGAGLLREIGEETGLKEAHLQGVCAIGRWASRASKKLAIFYRATVPGVKPELTLSGEHQRAVWIGIGELDSFPFHRLEMRDIVARELAVIKD